MNTIYTQLINQPTRINIIDLNKASFFLSLHIHFEMSLNFCEQCTLRIESWNCVQRGCSSICSRVIAETSASWGNRSTELGNNSVTKVVQVPPLPGRTMVELSLLPFILFLFGWLLSPLLSVRVILSQGCRFPDFYYRRLSEGPWCYSMLCSCVWEKYARGCSNNFFEGKGWSRMSQIFLSRIKKRFRFVCFEKLNLTFRRFKHI